MNPMNTKQADAPDGPAGIRPGRLALRRMKRRQRHLDTARQSTKRSGTYIVRRFLFIAIAVLLILLGLLSASLPKPLPPSYGAAVQQHANAVERTAGISYFNP